MNWPEFLRRIPVGNDVVDLRDPDSVPDSRHPRWDERVFTMAERASLRRAEAEERVRWALWSAKEAAFKAARKVDPDVRFIPRDFAVRLLDDARAEVRHGMHRFHVWFDHARDWIHAAAAPLHTVTSEAGSGPRWVVAFLGEEEDVGDIGAAEVAPGAERRADDPDGDVHVPPDLPSERVREVARRALAPLLDLDPEELRIAVIEGIPAVLRGDEVLPVDLSLSHHGRVVACSWSVGGR